MQTKPHRGDMIIEGDILIEETMQIKPHRGDILIEGERIIEQK